MPNATINGNAQFQLTQTGTGFLASVSPTKLETLKTVMQTAGTLADQVDTLYMTQLTFVASTPQTLDLAGGTLLDIFGAAAVFARVDLLLVKFLGTTNGQKLIMGGAGANEWSGTAAFLGASSTINVLAATANNDGYLVVAAPNTTGYVVDSTHKLLKLDPGSGAFSIEIVIAGRSV